MQLINMWFIWGPALALGVLSGYLSERVGIVNIGINGMMTFGVLFFYIFSNVFANSPDFSGANLDAFNWTFLLAFFISAFLSIPVGALFALAAIKLKADHVIAGTGINLLATGIGLAISDRSQRFFGQTALANRYVPSTVIGNSGINAESVVTFVIIMVIILLVYVVMNFSKLGLRYRACGENPNAVDAQGINVLKYQWLGILFASFIAGLGGALFGFASVRSSFNGDVNGLGFIALALLIVSSWKILPGIILALLFEFLLTFTQLALPTTVGSIENTFLLRMTPFLLTLFVMVVFGRFVVPPKFSGKHFDKGLR
ncbi:ABC transporter permease [[Mycoplasma] testudinis]|uniref:ABC transporter permease n=1 Tax=[Mycoplasma] testudinis TaxID=33924 RepID=UPI00048074E5|nr:ABC transporter permease [[Mycoplasma] testudinis]